MVRHKPISMGGSMTSTKWNKGDRVIHATKPEWGTGEVLQAEGFTHEGKACQRLTLRFDRAGLKTLSTAFAELKPATTAAPAFAFATTSDTSGSEGSNALDLPMVSPSEIKAMMTKLPDSATDPFTSLRSRFLATLSQYKFADTPGALLDWAAIQTGLKDPLTRFNRHELEQYFVQFRMAVDEHLKKLLREVRRAEPQLLAEVQASNLPLSCRNALRRADGGR